MVDYSGLYVKINQLNMNKSLQDMIKVKGKILSG